MEKITKQYECGLELMADDLNDIISLGNSIILYIKDHENEWENSSGNGNNVQITPLNSSGQKIAKFKIDNNPEEYIYAPSGSGNSEQNGDTTIIEPLNFEGDKVAIANFTAGNGSNTLYAPKPGSGGGGEGSAGHQRIFFANVSGSTAPSAPSPSDYDASADNGKGAFTRSTPQWFSTNTNPQEDENTYAIWVYFNAGGEIITIDGPICLTGAGTNGEDGEEIEWIYFHTQNELTVAEISTIQNQLQDYCKTGDNSKAGKVVGGIWIHNKGGGETYTWADQDVYPENWTDNAQGIDENNKYEYAAFRRSKNDEITKKRTWGDDYFHGPFLWSAYGKRGTDGDGVEYIFYADRGGIAPTGDINRPDTWMENENYCSYTDSHGVEHHYQDNEYILPNSNWTDEPVDLGSSEYGPGSKQWVSIRKKRIPEGKTEPSWSSYSEPKLWSGVGSDGIINGYIVTTSNPTMPVTTDAEGQINSFSGSSTFEVFHNSTRVDYTDDASLSSDHFMLSIDSSNIRRSDNGSTTGISAVSEAGGVVTITLSNVSNMGGTNIYVPVEVLLPDNSVRNIILTVIGIAGSEGGLSIDVYTGANVIRTDYYEQNVVPSTLNIGVKIGNSSGSTIYYSGAQTDSAEDKGYSFKYYYDNSSAQPIVGPIRVLTGHSSLTVIMYKNSQYLEEFTMPYVKDGAPGIGISAINYSIAILSTSVAVDGNTNYVSGEIHFKVFKIEGADREEIKTNPWTDNEEIKGTINGGTPNPTWVSSSDGEYWKIKRNSTIYDTNYPFSQIYVESVTNTILASVTVPIIINGRDGDSSSVQALSAVVMRFRSYDAIVSGSSLEPGDGKGNILNGTVPDSGGIIYMDVVLYDGSEGDCKYYRIAETNRETRNREWADDYPPSTGSSHGWIQFNRTADAAFTALLAKYAYIENLTANEIVITDDDGHPLAGMTRGSASANAIYPTQNDDPLNGITRGNVRIWAGYNSNTTNLLNSKFYVTEDGFLHAEDADIKGEISSMNDLVKICEEITGLDRMSNTQIVNTGLFCYPRSGSDILAYIGAENYANNSILFGIVTLQEKNSGGGLTERITSILPGWGSFIGTGTDNETSFNGGSLSTNTISTKRLAPKVNFITYSGGVVESILEVNSNTTMLDSLYIYLISGSGVTLTLPLNPLTGQTFKILSKYNYTLEVNSNTSHKINGDRTSSTIGAYCTTITTYYDGIWYTNMQPKVGLTI